ncbi:MAG: HEPN domain-containing protein [Deltaproteobacteria bacterium]|nr:HEPN domain-containing protein [Deltaproteobacteria bacterium]
MPERYSPDDPREWLNRAQSNLALAKTEGSGIYLEDLCFHAQQAAEKAVKALLIKQAVEFPYVHDLAELLTLLEQKGVILPEKVKQGEKLTRFAVFTRYPGIASPVSREEYEEALNLAEAIVHWVQNQIES